MSADKPLDGKCIVVTRAVEQSRDLKERLEKLGARVLLLPAVSFSEPADTTDLDRHTFAGNLRLVAVYERERGAIFCGPMP